MQGSMNLLVTLLVLLAPQGVWLHNIIRDSRLLAIFNGTAPALDVLMHIETSVGRRSPAGAATAADDSLPTNDLETIIRSEVAGDWQRGQLILSLTNRAKTDELKLAIYEALWQELQQTKQIYNPLRILDFYTQLKDHNDVPSNLLDTVYSTFIERSTQLLAAPFHTSSRTANFPLVDNLLQRLTFSKLDYLRDIFDLLYDIVLALESPESVAQRLGNFTANLTQLTLANLQLLKRPEIANATDAKKCIQDNIQKLLEETNFETKVEISLRQELYQHISEDERIFYSSQKICLRNVTQPNSYIYECPTTYLICSSNASDPKRAAYSIQRSIQNNSAGLQFAFFNAFWNNRYIVMESVPVTAVAQNLNTTSLATQRDVIFKNVYSKSNIYWWHVVFENDGVVLYDSSNRTSVLCGGDPSHWDGIEHHVYTRNGTDYQRYRNECTWKVENCSDTA
ncbi:uncharacterized protein Dwil_GK16906 [Drosophila willistoni]|uniref:Secreted protein n=1 Tax=Drosophila willistoni TaxID=7260 RepID=B4MLM0_DROWI|nr:uncharacterized protein LOC6639579 [Drosophila willistoni]EDW72946.1 uncharacterized protein Dwil_GK16906 [Drosophila willistoni]